MGTTTMARALLASLTLLLLAGDGRADESLAGKWAYQWWDDDDRPPRWSRCARLSKKQAAKLAKLDCTKDEPAAVRCDKPGMGWRVYETQAACKEDLAHFKALPL